MEIEQYNLFSERQKTVLNIETVSKHEIVPEVHMCLKKTQTKQRDLDASQS